MNTSGSEIKILAGNSSIELAQKIADYIGVPYQIVKLEHSVMVR